MKKMHKKDRCYWKVVKLQLIKVCGLAPRKAIKDVNEYIKEFQTLLGKHFELMYHSNLYEHTFYLSGVENLNPVGTCSFIKTTEYKWYENHSIELQKIEDSIYK